MKPATYSAYSQNWNSFQHFVTSHLQLTLTLPVSEHIICLYIAFLHSKPYRYATILSHLSSISFMHKAKGFQEISDSFLIQKILTGIKNSQIPRQPLLPINKAKLHLIVDQIPNATNHTYERLMYTAMFLLMYHACLRIGEVVPSTHAHNILSYQDIAFESNSKLTSLYITFQSYKHSNGKTPTLKLEQSSEGRYCPVKALLYYLHKRGSQPGPLFSLPHQQLSRLQVANFLKKLLSLAALQPSRFNTHSLRIGRTTDLAHSNQVSELDIQSIGRWKSTAYKHYIRPTHLNVPNF